MTSIIIFFLLFSHFTLADNKQQFDIKALNATGQIISLEMILDKLSEYHIERLLEIELEQDNNQYIYEIEYINEKGIVMEIKVDALTADVLKIEQEY